MAPPPQVQYGFTEAQKETLKCQILAFKKLKSGERITPDEWEGTKPATLPAYVLVAERALVAANVSATEMAARRERENVLRKEAAQEKAQRQLAVKNQATVLKQQRAEQAAQRKGAPQYRVTAQHYNTNVP